MNASMADLAPIPVRDVRDGGPLRHAREGRVAARALRDECVGWFPRAAQRAIPALDSPGIWFLNGAYEWGCTSLACEEGAPWLARTLDWPFPGLGRHVEIAH